MLGTNQEVLDFMQSEFASSGFDIYFGSIPTGNSGIVIKSYYGDNCCNDNQCNIVVKLMGTDMEIQNMINVLTVPPYTLTPYTQSNQYGANTYIYKKRGLECDRPPQSPLNCGCVYVGTYGIGPKQFPPIGNGSAMYFDESTNIWYKWNNALITPGYEPISNSIPFTIYNETFTSQSMDNGQLIEEDITIAGLIASNTNIVNISSSSPVQSGIVINGNVIEDGKVRITITNNTGNTVIVPNLSIKISSI